MGEYSVGLYTLGCKVSQYETEAIAEEFEKLGFLRRPFDEACDVYVINTCTVTAESNRKSRQIIRRAINQNKSAAVMVIGCYSQTTPEDIKKIDGVSYISGTKDKLLIPQRALSLLNDREKTPICEVYSLEDARFEDMRIEKTMRTRAYVKIEDGCDCRCTYCAVPNARGPVRSKPQETILEEIKTLASKGIKEVVLTGIEIASYGKDLGGIRLIDLLEKIEEEKFGVRIRLGSITPEILTDDFILRLKKISCLMPHLHISLQSGSDSVLRNMKRRYNTKQVKSSLSLLRENIPDVMFTCDVIVGFPMETEESFRETVDFMKDAKFLFAHIFSYSKRENTPAATYGGQLEEGEKRRRNRVLAKAQSEITEDLLQAIVCKGAPLDALFETCEDGVLTGHTNSFIEIRAKGDASLKGEIRSVTPLSYKNGILYCSIN